MKKTNNLLLLEWWRPGVSNAACSLDGWQKVRVALGALGARVRVGAFSQDQLPTERRELHTLAQVPPFWHKVFGQCFAKRSVRSKGTRGKEGLSVLSYGFLPNFTKSEYMQSQHANTISYNMLKTPASATKFFSSQDKQAQQARSALCLVTWIIAFSELPQLASCQCSEQNAHTL